MNAMLRHPIRFWRDHRFAMAHASAFVDGELTGAQARRIDDHTHICPKCHEMLASLRKLLHGLGAMKRTGDASVAPAVIDALRRDDRPREGY